jgi:hypothetical protein
MVDVRSTKAPGAAGHICGGVLVAPQWMLTARHCFTDNGAIDGALPPATVGTCHSPHSSRYLAPGRHKLSDSTPTAAAGVICEHPSRAAIDVVLVNVTQKIDAPIVRLVTPAMSTTEYSGEQSYILGWGKNSAGAFPDTLAQALTPLTAFAPLTCNRDDGGPDLLRRDGRWHLDATISQYACGTATAGTFVKTFSIEPWLSSIFGPTAGGTRLYNVPAPGTALGALLKPTDNFGTNWDNIVPGDFNGDGNDDLFLYHGSTGTGEVDFSDASGKLVQKSSSNTFANSWSQIVAGDFTDDPGKELLFYNAPTGFYALYNVSNTGALGFVRSSQDTGMPLPLGCEQLVPGNFDSTDRNDLFCYAPKTSSGTFYTNGAGIGFFLPMTSPPTSLSMGADWDVIRPGKFNADGFTDLFFYNGTSGTVIYATTNGSGGLATQVTNTGFSTEWTEIVPIENGTGRTGFMFYNQNNGETIWSQTLNGGGIGTQTPHSGFANYWSDIVPMTFGSFQDLLFYSQWGVP